MQFNQVETQPFIGKGFNEFESQNHARLWKVVFMFTGGMWEPAVHKRWDHSRPLSMRGWEVHQVLRDTADTNFDNALVKVHEWLVEQGILDPDPADLDRQRQEENAAGVSRFFEENPGFAKTLRG